jgi:hypothetical protein
VTVRNGGLVIRKKPDWRTDPELVELYEHKAKQSVTTSLIPRHPFDFHVRYYWQSTINFTVLNPDLDANWEAPVDSARPTHSAPSFISRLRATLLGTLRNLLAQTRRNRSINVRSLLQCPSCASQAFSADRPGHLHCEGCGVVFEVRGNVFDMSPPSETRS